MLDQKSLLLRGYVSPADFKDAKDALQKAVDLASALDICKVVVTEDTVSDAPVVLPSSTHLVIAGASVFADLMTEKTESVSFESECVYIEGRDGGTLAGSILLYNGARCVIEGLAVTGDVSLYFIKGARLENVTVGGRLTLGRGTANAIVQYVMGDFCAIDSGVAEKDVLGKEPTVRSLVLRESRFDSGVTAVAAPDYGLLNVQIDGISANVTVGDGNTAVGAGAYFNLTVKEITGDVTVLSPTKNLTL